MGAGDNSITAVGVGVGRGCRREGVHGVNAKMIFPASSWLCFGVLPGPMHLGALGDCFGVSLGCL